MDRDSFAFASIFMSILLFTEYFREPRGLPSLVVFLKIVDKTCLCLLVFSWCVLVDVFSNISRPLKNKGHKQPCDTCFLGQLVSMVVFI